ncbi:patatin-like phospholipase family protein [Hirschia baltica]|uniref:Cyclic nucleotide-binding protein n=1 Tax=Hirschia baltica (strain ATCC 49814 / DSM 5838 / IFAM 1418) TaxID=582402 RepID=C6XLA0_HIRBI|nr:patatin-like phospholipase family protein [Hirschia baltica]ACT59699.1 cyclic nucleotide-binding protein [Hirschia baltica ATCC 49814]
MGLLPSRENKLSQTILDGLPFLQDVPKSTLKLLENDMAHFSVPGGQQLFAAGAPADAIYFVISGSLGAFTPKSDGRSEFLGHIRTGEPVGEIALVAGENHQNDVYTLRDTELVRLTRQGFMKLIKSNPGLLERLTRVLLLRLRKSRRKQPRRAEPRVFALMATSPTIDVDLRAKALAKELENLSFKVKIVDESDADKDSRYFDDLEARHDIVIFKTAIGDSNWFRMSLRYADRIWILARADAHPSSPLMPDDESPTRQFKLVDIILLHHGNSRIGAEPAKWRDAAKASRIFHWDGLNDDDCKRLARVMAGRSVGLVMSGGGARAYASIGAVRALREAKCPIDLVGGTSMGAVVAACVASGWSDDEIDRRIRKAFVESNPLADYTLPVVGLVKGHRVDGRLAEHFGDINIESLEIPFYAVSTNLTHGAVRIHTEGLLRQALRASIALPGILPPIVDGEQVLVDGGVLNNFPSDVMRELHRGKIIGVDVAQADRGLNPQDFVNPPGFFRWTMKHGFSAAPPIAALLMRAATVSVDPKDGSQYTDVLITPDIEDTELRDWKAYDDIVERGYIATKKALTQLNGPIARTLITST